MPTKNYFQKNKQGLKTATKHTIKDSQESFLHIAKNVQAVEDHIEHRKRNPDNIQPLIIIVGEDILSFKQCFLYLDDIKFPFDSFIRAVDICFKIFVLFNLKYPNPSASFWTFIESLYFEEKTNVCTKTHILLSALRE